MPIVNRLTNANAAIKNDYKNNNRISLIIHHLSFKRIFRILNKQIVEIKKWNQVRLNILHFFNSFSFKLYI